MKVTLEIDVYDSQRLKGLAEVLQTFADKAEHEQKEQHEKYRAELMKNGALEGQAMGLGQLRAPL